MAGLAWENTTGQTVRPLIEDCEILPIPCSRAACETNIYWLQKSDVSCPKKCGGHFSLFLIREDVRVTLEANSIVQTAPELAQRFRGSSEHRNSIFVRELRD